MALEYAIMSKWEGVRYFDVEFCYDTEEERDKKWQELLKPYDGYSEELSDTEIKTTYMCDSVKYFKKAYCPE